MKTIQILSKCGYMGVEPQPTINEEPLAPCGITFENDDAGEQNENVEEPMLPTQFNRLNPL